MVSHVPLIQIRKASSLNEYFSGCFNTFHQPISTMTISGTADHECAPELLCTEDEICAFHNHLTHQKLAGPMEYLLTC